MTMESDHILNLAADYALGLLSPEQRRRVERHARQCPDCRDALQRERGLEALVRGAVHQAARPTPGRLSALRPAVVARPAARPRPLHRQLAPVTLVAILLALGMIFGRGRSPFTPAVFAGGTPTQTATSTRAPTATLAAIAPALETATHTAPAPAPQSAGPGSPSPVAASPRIAESQVMPPIAPQVVPPIAPPVAPTPIIITAVP